MTLPFDYDHDDPSFHPLPSPLRVIVAAEAIASAEADRVLIESRPRRCPACRRTHSPDSGCLRVVPDPHPRLTRRDITDTACVLVGCCVLFSGGWITLLAIGDRIGRAFGWWG